MSDLPASLRSVLELSREPAGSAFHTAQVSISFGEEIDPAALRAAWVAVARSYPALRTAWEDDTPRECPEPVFAWQELDWQGDPPADLGAAWQALFNADGATPVTAEPHRITLLRLPNGGGHALWSFHAALIDEESVSAALHRWLIAYDYVRSGAEPPAFEDLAPAPETGPVEEISAPAPLLLLPLPEETAAGTRRSLSHTYERAERQAFAAAAEAAGSDLRALVTAVWSFVAARAQDAGAALLFEATRPGTGIGRIETFALRRRDPSAAATAAELIRTCGQETPVLRCARVDPRAIVALLYRDLALNDRLQLELPRWMAADAQLYVRTVPPLTLRFVASDRPVAALDYDPAILSDASARALFTAFQETLAAFVADPDLPLAGFTLPGAPAIVAAEEAAPTFRSLVTQGIHEMFADAAAETPDAPAVEGEAETLTFDQLNVLANQISRLLRKRGLNAGGRVALAMERSPQWVAALLGTLKAGGVIVLPGAAESPADAWIVDELAEGERREQPVIQIRTEAAALAAEKSRGVSSETEPTSPALAWETAGEEHIFDHATLAAALQSLAAMQSLSPADRVLQFAAPLEFTAIEETLSALLSGATLVLRPNAPWGTRTAFQEFIEQKAVTALAVPTAFWTQWTHYLAELSLTAPATLRLAVTTGALPAPNAAAAWAAVGASAQWRHRHASAATGGLGLVATPEGTLAPSMLGRPGPATVARVADHHGLPQPFGFPGHVEIAPGSAPDHFRALDLPAIATPDGTFFDVPALRASQGELPVEMSASALRFAAIAHPQVFDAHAETRLIAARQEWCLWIIPRDSESGEPHDLRDWLTQRLPACPRRIRALPRFPLNDAGHLDLTALDELLPDDSGSAARRRGNELEERVREALSRALGGRTIDLDEVLTEGRTKPPVAQRLHEAVSRVEPRVQLEDFTTPFSVSSLLRNVRGRKTGADSRWKPIEPLRASGKQPPLIFVHDLDGTPRIYGSLVARLGEDQPCYGISARGLAEPAAAHATVESMAAAYLEALREFDGSGGHRLVGYGFGGLVAFEMARQLTAAGVSVPLLVLLATEPPVGITASGLLAGGWRRALPALFGGRKAADSAPRRRPADNPVLRANQEAARRYSAANVPVTAHIFAPEDEFPPARTIQSGWSACCADARFYQVPCSGQEMMEEPAAEDLAGILARLARSEDLTPGLDGEE